MDKDSFDKIFEDKFSSFEPQPSDELKNEIFATLKSGGISVFQGLSLAILLLFLSASVYYFIQKEKHLTINKNTENQALAIQTEGELEAFNYADTECIDNQETSINSTLDAEICNENREQNFIVANKSLKKTRNSRIAKSKHIEPIKKATSTEVKNKNQTLNPNYLRKIEPKNTALSMYNQLLAISINKKQGVNKKEGTSLGKVLLPKSKTPKLFATAGLETFMNYNNIQVNRRDQLLISDINNKAKISLDRLGLRFQIGFGINISDKLSVIGQLTTQIAQYNVSFKEQAASFDSLTIEELPNQILVKVHRSKTSKTIDINRYSIGYRTGIIYRYKKTTKINSSISVFASYLSDIGNKDNYLRTNQLYLSVGHRFDYLLNERISFLFEPTIAYSLWNGEINDKLFLKPYSIGLGFGVLYNIRRKEN